MSKDFAPLIKKLSPYAAELTPALVTVLLNIDTKKYHPLKAELKKYLEKTPNPKHSQYLEIIAMAHGYKDYNTLSAYLNKFSSPSLMELEAREKSARGIFWNDKVEKIVYYNLDELKKNVTANSLGLDGFSLSMALRYFIRMGDYYLEEVKYLVDVYKKSSEQSPSMQTKFTDKSTQQSLMSSLGEDGSLVAKFLIDDMDKNYDIKVYREILNSFIMCGMNKNIDLFLTRFKEEVKLNTHPSPYYKSDIDFYLNYAIQTKNKKVVEVLLKHGATFHYNSLSYVFKDWLIEHEEDAKDQSEIKILEVSKFILSKMTEAERAENIKNIHHHQRDMIGV